MKRNRDLKKFYNKVFAKGEKRHFTKFSETKTLPSDEREALKELQWNKKKVLEIGCGTGLFTYEIARRGARVLAVDYSSEAIRIAKEKYRHPNLNFVCRDARKILGKYDVVASLGTLEHMDRPFSALKLFKRRLKPNGSIIITCPNWINPRGYMLMTLFCLFDAPVTLADLHYLSPLDFKKCAKELKMSLRWRTFDISRACGEDLIKDFEKRIPNVLRDANLPCKKKNIKKFIRWIKKNILPFEHKAEHIGATAIYHFKKR